MPALEGAKVLEIGCGHGERVMQIATLGASQAVGVDIMATRIEQARQSIKELPEEIRGRISFVASNINDVDEDNFDIVVSENAFEHINEVDEVLGEIKKRLKVGGKAYIGFGPLYHSPYGDHEWMRAVLPFRKYFPWPWGHLFFRNYIFRKLSEQHDTEITDTANWPYLALNEKSVDDFLRLFEESGLELASVEYNPAQSFKAKLFKLIGRFKPTRKYFTWAILAVLEKKSTAD